MRFNPSDSVFPGIADSSPVAQDILSWFDDIYTCYVFKSVTNPMYKLLSFERAPDNLLDYFLFDKGFSTHEDLLPAAKRCILRNWATIYNYRMSSLGLKTYLECVTQETVDLAFVHNPKSRFIQSSSTKFGFPNEASLLSRETAADSMTYLYSPEYGVTDTLEVALSSQTTYTDLLTDYIFEIIRYEMPKTNSDHLVEVTIKVSGGATIAVKTL